MRHRLAGLLLAALLSLTACQTPLASPPGSHPSSAPPAPRPLSLKLDGGWDVSGTLHDRLPGQFIGDVWPDAAVAAGPGAVLVVTNGEVQLRSRAGALLTAALWSDLFAPAHVDPSFMVFDPRAIFDASSGRFFVSILASGRCPNTARCPVAVLLAVSTTSDPRAFDAASWHVFDLQPTTALPAGDILDFDSLAVSTTAVVMIVHPLNALSNNQLGIQLWMLPKAGLLAGVAPVSWPEFDQVTDDSGAGLNALMPVRGATGAGPLYLAGLSPGSRCNLDVTAVEDGAGAPRATSHTIAVPVTCPAATFAPQPGTATGLAVGITGGGLASEPIYRDRHIWIAWTTGYRSAGAAVPAVAWAEIDVSHWPQPPTLVQESVLGGAGTATFYPVLAAGAGGTMVMAFGRSGPSELPSLYFTGRQRGDPAGGLREPVLVKASARAARQGRFGDYLAAAADPADGSVWLLGTYVQADVKSGMWLGHVT
jgi:hypothetical protein